MEVDKKGLQGMLNTMHVTLYTMHVTLYMMHVTLYMMHITLYTKDLPEWVVKYCEVL